ncbi:DNA circulation protein [Salmonella enterica subsp. enterica serovar Muenchen]|nr:DNA circulation protein [Salmonella enterica subsp. enterica serovar Muenchen]
MSDILTQLAELAGIDTLMPASFRGVKFECVYTRDTLARDTVSYAYPYHDGATVEDQGLKALNFRLSALLFGHDWKQQLKALLTALKASGPGELIHPVYGSIPRAQFLEAGVEKQVEPLDAVTVELVFIESGEEQALFSTASGEQAADSIATTGDSLLDKAASAFKDAMDVLHEVQDGAERINNIVAEGEYLLQSTLDEVRSAGASLSNLLDTPTALVSDLNSILETFSDTLTLEGSGVATAWQSARHLADKVTRFPAEFASTLALTVVSKAFALPLGRTMGIRAEDTALLTRTARLVTTTELLEIASTILTNEAKTPTLTSTRIEQITGDARDAVVLALSEQRAAMEASIAAGLAANVTADTRTFSTIIRDLQSMAYTLQNQAAALIKARPPLVTREVTRRGTLLLIAHDWYGDYCRASELLRLNPHISNPNNIQPGEVLYAYAR